MDTRRHSETVGAALPDTMTAGVFHGPNDLRIEESDRRIHGPRPEGDTSEIPI